MRYFPDVIIIYEHKARELYSCYLLKYELKKRGIYALVCHNSYRHTWWVRLLAKPKIVISLCALTTELIPGWMVFDQHSSFLRCSPSYYINLQIEQIFRENHAQYNIVTDKKYKDMIYYVCWGDYRKKQILKEGIEASHIWVTGALQLDFCRKEWMFLFMTKTELAKKYKINEKKKWILFVSSFPYVTYSKKELEWGEKIKNDYQDMKKELDGYELKKVATNTYQTILDWIDWFLKEKQFIFIYRPHPGERKTRKIEELIQKYPKQFFYLAEGSIHQWIRACDIVDTWVSTAYAEAIFLDKPCNLIQPYGAPLQFEPIYCSPCKKIHTYSEFVKVHKNENQKDLKQEKERLHLYYKWEEVPAYIEICNQIEQLFYDKKSVLCSNKKKIVKYLFTKAYFLELYVSFVFTFGIKIYLPYRGNKLKQFNEKLKKGGDIYMDCFITKAEKEMLKKLKKYIEGKNYAGFFNML